MSFQPPPYHQPPQTFTPPPKLTLRPRANEPVSVDSQFGSYTVTEGSREWGAVGGFTATSAGTYTLSCREGALAAFGPDPDIGGLFGKIFGIFALFCAGPALGLVVFLVILAMRASDKKRQRREPGRI